jgi:predicted DNA-binding transcriptional regulator YafY
VSRPASRLLGFLELLQNCSGLVSAAAANELGVSERTIRRYAVALQELGIHVEGQSGLGGGYRLRPGTHLPPLMLSDEEAVAAVYGLVLADERGLSGAARALDKVGCVLPEAIGLRIDRLRSEVVLSGEPTTPAVSGEILLRIAEAVRRRRSLVIDYVRGDGTESGGRQIEPLGLVARQGRWYVPARDRARGELRTFRADRIRAAALGDGAAPPDPGFDPLTYVVDMLKRLPRAWEIEVLVHGSVADIETRIPSTVVELHARGDRTQLSMKTDSLQYAATLLVGLDCDFDVLEPPALREELARLSSRLAAAASAAAAEQT